MKKIADIDARKIYDFSQESSLGLPAYVLEKDMHVCDAMRIIEAMPANPYFSLVFCGGTCLSKAYGILERMSEDVDFKVVPNAAGLALGRSATRTQLRAFATTVAAALASGGFTGKGAVARRSNDEGECNTITVQYESAFEKPESLRAHLLIEMNYTTLVMPTQTNGVGLLLDRLKSVGYSKPLQLACVSLVEALAEKMILFPRRLGKQMAEQIPDGDPTPKTYDDKFLEEKLHWDKSLVRHIYDVNILLEKHPALLSNMDDFGRLLSEVVKKDAVDFKNKHADYIADPVKELQAAMAFAKTSKKLRDQYDKFVIDMVYGEAKPSYVDAVAYFESALNVVLTSSPFQKAISVSPVAAQIKPPKPSSGGPVR